MYTTAIARGSVMPAASSTCARVTWFRRMVHFPGDERAYPLSMHLMKVSVLMTTPMLMGLLQVGPFLWQRPSFSERYL